MTAGSMGLIRGHNHQAKRLFHEIHLNILLDNSWLMRAWTTPPILGALRGKTSDAKVGS